MGTAVFSTNKTDRHDIIEIVLIVAINTIIIALIQNKEKTQLPTSYDTIFIFILLAIK
jgi:hypothetical protein